MRALPVATVYTSREDGILSKRQTNTQNATCMKSDSHNTESYLSNSQPLNMSIFNENTQPVAPRDSTALVVLVTSMEETAGRDKECNRLDNESSSDKHRGYDVNQMSYTRAPGDVDVDTVSMTSNSMPTSVATTFLSSPSQAERRLERAVESLTPNTLLSPQKHSTQCRTRSLVAQQTVLAMLSM